MILKSKHYVTQSGSVSIWNNLRRENEVQKAKTYLPWSYEVLGILNALAKLPLQITYDFLELYRLFEDVTRSLEQQRRVCFLSRKVTIWEHCDFGQGKCMCICT